MNTPKVTTVHHRTISGYIEPEMLNAIVAEALIKMAGERVQLRSRQVNYKVRFEDRNEGSPPYKTGTRAFVEIVEDLSPAPDALPEVSAPPEGR